MIGRVFDRKYRVESLIGKGGMGEVYEAVHVILERRVALKVMHAELVTDSVAAERFLREAMAASEIGHANIVDVQDVGIEDDGTVFIVMELLEGKTLDRLVREKESLHPALATRIILGVLTGLHAAHRKGIVHRDLKLENVLITLDSKGQEVVKLFDFGIAVFQKHQSAKEDLSLTAPGRLVGTPNYLSPEQIRGKKEIDGRVDVWAAGVMLYEMLTGMLPFEGESYEEVLSKILLEEPTPLEQLVPRIPEQLVEIVGKALTKDREERYQGAGEFIGDLYMLQGPSSNAPDPVTGISGSFARVDTGDYSQRTSRPGTGDRSGPLPKGDSGAIPADRGAVTADLEAIDPNEISSSSHVSDGSSPSDSGAQESTPMVWREGDEPGAGRFGVGFWAASGVALLAIVGIVVVLAISSGGDEPAAVEPPAVAAPAAPVVAEEPEPEPEPATAPVEEAEPVPEEEPVPELVSVTLEGMPEGAKAFLDGEQISAEFERPRSDKPYVLRVEAPGHEAFEKAVVLRRDLTVVVGMAKKTFKLRIDEDKKSAGGAETGEQGGEKDGSSLLGNPFGG